MREFIFVISLNFSIVFFNFLAIIGISYSNSIKYDNFSISIALLNVIYIVGMTIFKNDGRLSRISILFYLLPLITLIFYMIDFPDNPGGRRIFFVYLAYSFPAIYIGTFVASNNLIKSTAKWWNLLPIFITLGMIISFDKIVSTNDELIGGALSYQVVSYIASFAFSLNLFFLLFGDKYQRFSFLNTHTYTIVTYLMMIFQISVLFISGGRGGFVVLFLSALILIIIKFNKRVLYSKVILIIVLLFSTLYILKNILPVEIAYLLQRGFDRVFSYISFDGIDIHETSGRDTIYFSAIGLIKESPIYGYGIFKYFDLAKHYPHNIFLEILLQGGLLYLSFWIIVLTKFYFKIKRMIKFDETQLLLIPIAIYPIVQLMFSGSYLMSTLFWFVISYVFNFKITSNQKTAKQIIKHE
jgi:O-antigen ligase